MRISKTLLAIVILGAFCTGCRHASSGEAPSPLVGLWKTPHPRYTDRYFEIRRRAIVFGLGAGRSEVYALRHVELETLDDRIRYTLYYIQPDGAESTFRFFFDGAIRLANLEEIIWTKTELPDEARATD